MQGAKDEISVEGFRVFEFSPPCPTLQGFINNVTKKALLGVVSKHFLFFTGEREGRPCLESQQEGAGVMASSDNMAIGVLTVKRDAVGPFAYQGPDPTLERSGPARRQDQPSQGAGWSQQQTQKSKPTPRTKLPSVHHQDLEVNCTSFTTVGIAMRPRVPCPFDLDLHSFKPPSQVSSPLSPSLNFFGISGPSSCYVSTHTPRAGRGGTKYEAQ